MPKFWSKITYFPLCVTMEFYVFPAVTPWKLENSFQYDSYFEILVRRAISSASLIFAFDDFWFIKNPTYESRMKEAVTLSSLFPNTKEKMVQIFFRASFHMYFYDILKPYSKRNVLWNF